MTGELRVVKKLYLEPGEVGKDSVCGGWVFFRLGDEALNGFPSALAALPFVSFTTTGFVDAAALVTIALFLLANVVLAELALAAGEGDPVILLSAAGEGGHVFTAIILALWYRVEAGGAAAVTTAPSEVNVALVPATDAGYCERVGDCGGCGGPSFSAPVDNRRRAGLSLTRCLAGDGLLFRTRCGDADTLALYPRRAPIRVLGGPKTSSFFSSRTAMLLSFFFSAASA